MSIPKTKFIKRPAYQGAGAALPDSVISDAPAEEISSQERVLAKTVGMPFSRNPPIFRQAFDVLSLWFMLGFLSGAIGILLVLSYFF
ncbi:MAG: hypothetical protein ACFFB3_22330 [Candidatus Hodarchaeota archaeon]